MPFTLSHAGFVTPFRKYFSPQILCALMIGSIIPDLGYFIRQFGIASFAHSVPGAFLISLPLGYLLYRFITGTFLRFARLLPQPHAAFLATWNLSAARPAPSLIPILAALLVGSFSHNFLDSFTHETGQALGIFPVLKRDALILQGETLPLYRLLQYSGSAIGLALLLIPYAFALRSYCLRENTPLWQDPKRWLGLLALFAGSGCLAILINFQWLPSEPGLYAIRVFTFKFLITWIPLFGLALGALALLLPFPATNTKSFISRNPES